MDISKISIIEINKDCINNNIDPIITNYISELDFFEIKNNIYIELWYNNKDFKDYFKTPEITNVFTGENKEVEGLHQYDIDNITHQIAIIMNDNWKETLLHELLHCWQCEVVGFERYKELKTIYEKIRDFDPFELQAYFISKKILENKNYIEV